MNSNVLRCAFVVPLLFPLSQPSAKCSPGVSYSDLSREDPNEYKRTVNECKFLNWEELYVNSTQDLFSGPCSIPKLKKESPSTFQSFRETTQILRVPLKFSRSKAAYSDTEKSKETENERVHRLTNFSRFFFQHVTWSMCRFRKYLKILKMKSLQIEIEAQL